MQEDQGIRENSQQVEVSNFDEGEEEDIAWRDDDAMDWCTVEELERLHEVGSTPLYEGAKLTTLQAVILMLNHHLANNSTNVQTDQAFELQHRVLLPRLNTMPDSEYAASQMLRKLGLEFENIEVCPNNYILICGVFKEHLLCPSCGRKDTAGHGSPRRYCNIFL